MMIKYYAMGFGLSVSGFLHSLSAVTSPQRSIMSWKLSNCIRSPRSHDMLTWSPPCATSGQDITMQTWTMHSLLDSDNALLLEGIISTWCWSWTYGSWKNDVANDAPGIEKKRKQAEKNKHEKGKDFIVLVPNGTWSYVSGMDKW